MKMAATAIIQARMGSSRLPGKVLKKLCDRSVLGHVITRIREVREVDNIIIATTTKSEDDAIAEEAEYYGVSVYRGSEHDVLSRYYEAAKMYGANTIVRITSDCPLIDSEITAQVIRHFFSEEADYVSNTIVRTFPRGLDLEVFSFGTLEAAYKYANKQEQREHVTPYIYQNSDMFRIIQYTGQTDYSRLRWTLDTEEDWMLIKEIYERLYPKNKHFSWEDALRLVQANPQLCKINEHVEQKKLGE